MTPSERRAALIRLRIHAGQFTMRAGKPKAAVHCRRYTDQYALSTRPALDFLPQIPIEGAAKNST